eukprot:420760_1
MTTLIMMSFFVGALINNAVSQLVSCTGINQQCSCPLTSGQTCVLDCNNTDICKESTLNCRANDPCQIQCTATTSCSSGTKINAATATNVTIICQEEDSCVDSIYIMCGIGHCQLECDHEKACIDWGYIDVSLSSSFHCIGYCPDNIPAPFVLYPTIEPTLYPTIEPTLNPIMEPNTIIPSIYYNNPTITPFIIGKNEIDAKETGNLDVLMIGFIIIGFCMSCVATIWLFHMLSKQRRKSTSQTDHKPTISTSMTNMNYELDSELYHKSPSMDLRPINGEKTPIRASILSIKNATITGKNNDTDTESSFSVETLPTERYSGHSQVGHSGHNNTADSLSFLIPSINQSESGIDYNDKCRRNSSESIMIQNGTPSGLLPAIPDHKSVNQSLDHLMVEHITQLSDMSTSLHNDFTLGEDDNEMLLTDDDCDITVIE